MLLPPSSPHRVARLWRLQSCAARPVDAFWSLRRHAKSAHAAGRALSAGMVNAQNHQEARQRHQLLLLEQEEEEEEVVVQR